MQVVSTSFLCCTIVDNTARWIDHRLSSIVDNTASIGSLDENEDSNGEVLCNAEENRTTYIDTSDNIYNVDGVMIINELHAIFEKPSSRYVVQETKKKAKKKKKNNNILHSVLMRRL
eukprot:129030_1